jgi:hypothetical protein
MGTLTTRLKLFKPANTDAVDVDVDLDQNYDKIDAAAGLTICTSSTRPSGGSLYSGLTIYETDTNLVYCYDGATWQFIGGKGTILRIAQAKRITNSASVSSETIVDTVTFTALNSKKYLINYHSRIIATAANATAIISIREDNVSGTQLASNNFASPLTTGGYGAAIHGEYDSAAAGSKTIVGTLNLFTGGGTIGSGASSTVPTYLTIDMVI